MRHKRKCPKCKKVMIYTRKSSSDEANRKNTSCRACILKERLKNPDDKMSVAAQKIHERHCPRCLKEMIYKTSDGCIRAIRNKTLCRSCNLKIKWLDPEYREKALSGFEDPEYREKMKIVYKSPEYREERIHQANERWLDPEYREKQSKGIRIKWEDPVYREKAIKGAISRFESPEYREKISKIFKGLWQDPEYREKLEKAMKERWEDPEYREKVSKGIKIKWEDPEYRAKYSEKFAKIWEAKQAKQAKQAKMDPERSKKWYQGRFNIYEDIVAEELLNELMEN